MTWRATMKLRIEEETFFLNATRSITVGGHSSNKDRKRKPDKYFTKIVAQTLQFLDKRPTEDEPLMKVEEDAGDYDTE